MRAVYWIGDRVHEAQVWVGDWALKERHRPLIVVFVLSVAVAGAAILLLELMEIISGRQQ